MILDELLEQHNSYELGEGVSLGRRDGAPWYIYFNGKEIHFAADLKAPIVPFPTVHAALTYLLTRKGTETLERVGLDHFPNPMCAAASPSTPADREKA